VTGAIALSVFALAWSSLRPQRAWRTAPAWLRDSLFPFGSAFVLISTGGLLYLDGFSMPSLASWARHFEGLTSEQSWHQAWLVMAGYEPAALLLGLPAALLGLWRWRLRLGEPDAALLAFLSLWALMGLVFLLLGGTADATSVYASGLPLSVLAGYVLAKGLADIDRETLGRFAWGLPLLAACSVFAGINILRAASEGTPIVSPWLALAALVLPLAVAPVLAAGSPRPAALLACFVGLAAVLLSVHGISRLRDSWPGQISGQSQAVQTLRDVTRLKPYTTSGQGFFALVQQDLRAVAAWHLRDLRSVSYTGQVARGPALLIGEAGSSPAEIPGYQRRVVPVIETWTPNEWGLGETVRWIATGDIPPRSRITRRAAVYVSREGPA
jgi:4-amino-4-deoxy-L-arabinose transferase-like glycosyltransferase